MQANQMLIIYHNITDMFAELLQLATIPYLTINERAITLLSTSKINFKQWDTAIWAGIRK